jgi:hypothetical protein
VVRFFSPTDTLALAGWELCNEVGLHKLNPVDPQLESAGFQPSSL